MALIERCNFQKTDTAAVDASLRPRFAPRGELPLSLALRHGRKVDCRLCYELVGHRDGPVLAVAGGISAGRHVVSSEEFPEAGWWEAQRASFALEHNQILAIDWVGAEGEIDLPIHPADQADAIAQLLAELGISKVTGFIGASYGGMVGMEFAVRHPDRLGALLAISAAGHSHPYSSACRSLQRQALLLGDAGGNPEAGVALARAMAMLTYRTPEEFADRFGNMPRIEADRVRVGADDYLAGHGTRYCRRMSSTAYRRLSESIDLHWLEAGDIGVPLTIAAVDRDALVPVADVEALARGVSGARFRLVRSHFGHDAFLKEVGQIANIITEFLSSLEHGQ